MLSPANKKKHPPKLISSAFIATQRNKKRTKNTSPLYRATAAKELEQITACLDLGHSPITSEINGHSPLSLAIQHEQIETVKLFLKNLSATDIINKNKGQNLLHIAATYGSVNSAQCIINHMQTIAPQLVPALINKRNRSGKSPIHVAAWHNKPEFVRWCLLHHIPPSLHSLRGKYILDDYTIRTHIIVKELLEQAQTRSSFMTFALGHRFSKDAKNKLQPSNTQIPLEIIQYIGSFLAKTPRSLFIAEPQKKELCSSLSPRSINAGFPLLWSLARVSRTPQHEPIPSILIAAPEPVLPIIHAYGGDNSDYGDQAPETIDLIEL